MLVLPLWQLDQLANKSLSFKNSILVCIVSLPYQNRPGARFLASKRVVPSHDEYFFRTRYMTGEWFPSSSNVSLVPILFDAV